MPEVEQVAARNMMPGPTVLSLDLNGRLSVEWMGAKDPDGNDVKYVPEEIVKSVQFKRALRLGILQVEEDPDTYIDKQSEAWTRRYEQNQADALAAIDYLPQNDYLGLECVGPSREGSGGACGVMVPLKASLVKITPPLCDKHVQLAPQYMSEPGVEERPGDDGTPVMVPVTRWRRM